ncbi:hypothetical protein C9446_11055 [Providencia heimbachae]|uniref:STY1053 family phage-associated protein n=1 Tax=Providencia heimbachae TaxID=333962 RepID=UPI0010BEAD14|nr:hypothetical protein C9446_11055 [Providencia heimbachae]
MKYIVAKGAKLSFPDGTHFELFEGIHDSAEFSKQVTGHWAFSAYAKPLDESELQKEEESKNMSVKIKSLEDEIIALKATLQEKDDIITSQSDEIIALKAASSTETKSDKKQGAADGKKQPSADS